MSNIAGSGAVPLTVTTGNATVTGKGRLVGVSLTHSAAGSAILYDALTQTGTKLAHIACLTNDTVTLMFGDEGVAFNTGISVTVTGTCIIYVKQ